MFRSNPKNIGIFTIVHAGSPGPTPYHALPLYWEMSIKRDKSVGGNRWVDKPHVGRKYVNFRTSDKQVYTIFFLICMILGANKKISSGDAAAKSCT
jgi:hypothetical protein